MDNTKIREENERVNQKIRETRRKAYDNMNSAFNDSADYDGINAILKFLNEKERINTSIPIPEQLRSIEEKYSLKMRYADLDDDWYKTAVIPMLVKDIDGHWDAVLPNEDGTCVYIDSGRRIKITAKNAGRFTSSAICFYKGMKNGRITMRDLILFLAKCTSVKVRIAAVATGAAAVLAGMLLPWVTGFIFAKIIPAGEISGTASAAALIFSAVTVTAALNLLQSIILTNSMLRTSMYTQSGIFSRLLSLKPDFFKDIKSGELSQMIMDFSDISRIVSVRSISACICMVLSLMYLIQIYTYAPQLFVWVIAATAALIVIMISEGLLEFRWIKDYSASLSKMSGFGYEMFSGIEQVKLNGAEGKMAERWSERYLDASIKENKPFLLKYADAFYKLFTVIITAGIFILGSRLSASDYIAFSAAFGAYMASIFGMTVIIQMISSFRSSYALIKPMLEDECEENGESKKKPESITGEITVSDLHFRYDKDMPYVINGLSAHIKPGESVGIIGMSGCGKSTLVRLLLGFETAEEGSVYIDGYDIRELNLKSYRKRIGTVLQNSGLIQGDIYTNITLTNPSASAEEVRAAVDMAGLSRDIDALPMGLSTPISTENSTFSGGQVQRILIARALTAKPSILIFDEATSALDNITQAKIIEEVNKLSCTKIIVAHRLSTIERCSRILVMDKGYIVQEGTYDELRNSEGLFAELIKRQNV